jgi:hypothetical protein
MRRLKIEVGQRFGRLRVVRETDRAIYSSGQTHRMFVVLCDCNQELSVLLGSLRSGNTVSCGCYSRELTAALKPGTRHGMSHTPTHKSWLSMRERAAGKSADKARNYQSRGITICERWATFENFLADMGERPRGTTLDRIDNDGNYEPSNCRWADVKTQGTNRRTTRFVTLNGEQLSMTHAAAKLGFNYKTITDYGARRGWTLQQAIDYYASR